MPCDLPRNPPEDDLAPALGFPSWSSLREDVLRACRSQAGVQAFLPYIDGSGRKLKRAALDLFCQTSAVLPRQAQIRVLCQGNRDDLILFLLQQLDQNAKGGREDPSGDLLFRAHHQLPCTHSTLQRRVREVQRHVLPDEPVLIIGDDDMQSIALARAGYTDITVVEIDGAIADTITRATEPLPGTVQVIREDITRVDPALARPFRAALIDPPCHVPGFLAFLNGVVRLNTKPSESLLFLNTNLLSYGREGHGRVAGALAQHGFSACEVWLGFNAYPLPRLPRLGFNTLLHAFEPRSSLALHSFFSDLVLVRQGVERQAAEQATL